MSKLNCKDGCEWYDEKICEYGRCACDEAMTREMEDYYGYRREDKLDKPATEITPWDVYSPSELL